MIRSVRTPGVEDRIAHGSRDVGIFSSSVCATVEVTATRDLSSSGASVVTVMTSVTAAFMVTEISVLRPMLIDTFGYSIGEKPFPGTRAKSAALARAHFVKALEYRKKIEAAKGAADKMPARDLDMEAMLQVLDGKRIVQHHTHRSDDIMTVLRLQKEFGFRVVLQHVSEGHLVAKEIADAKVPCSIIVIDSPGGKQEALNLVFENGAALEKAGRAFLLAACVAPAECGRAATSLGDLRATRGEASTAFFIRLAITE